MALYELPPFKEVAPLVLQAYRKGELQINKLSGYEHGICQYDGPCAIGILLPKDVRMKLDNTMMSSISSFFNRGTLTAPTPEDEELYIKLQDKHDNLNKGAFYSFLYRHVKKRR